MSSTLAGQLCVEMSEILFDFYLLRSLSPDSNDPLENLKAIRFVQLLINDITLRLCKFRDDDTRSLSFDQVYKVLRKRSASADRVTGLEQEIARYRQLTKNLESHRDAHIAHLSKRGRWHLKPLVEIHDSIRMAVTITDKLSAGPNTYKLLDIDL